MKIRKKNLLNVFFLFIILLIILFLYFKNIDFSNKNIFIMLTFVINGIFIIFNILKDWRAFSLSKTFWYFSFFFFFLAPFFQYLTGYNNWNYVLNENTYIDANLYLLLWFLAFSISYSVFSSKQKQNFKDEYIEINIDLRKLRFLFILSLISFIILVANISFTGLFVRSYNKISISSSVFKVIFENTLRAIPIYSLINSFLYLKQNKKGYFYFIVLLLLTIFVNFPASITRYWIGIVYIGIGLVLFGKFIKNRRFDYAMLLVFAVVFPIFQLFKWYTVDQIFDITTLSSKLSSVYNNVDFDAYSMFGRTIEYVNENGLTLGHQVLSTLFFFVPRAIWPSKPVPTGEFIATEQNQFFTNLSCPFIAEGFVDFHFLGSIVYVLLLSKIISCLDTSFWKLKDKNSFLYLIYPFCFGVLIFLMRGSMQPVVVYTFTYYLFSVFLRFFIGKKTKI